MTPFLASLWIFLFGIILGSFLNVVIFRYNSGSASWRVFGGRSKCLSCSKQLHWHELIPLFSFLFQRGRCRGCRSKISWQYPIVELLTGLIFLLIWQLPLPLVSKLVYLIIASLLIVIAVYDLRHLIIPDGLVYTFVLLALAHAVYLSWLNFGSGLLINHLLAGLGLAAFFWILWWLSSGRWLGFADGKLALGVGFLLGPSGGTSAVMLAFWSGALVGLVLMTLSRLLVRRRRITMKSELPFAPFLILGLALVIFFNLHVFAF